MHSHHRFAPVLASGEFYGTAQTTKEVSGFVLSCMSPVVPPEDMQLHMHREATLVMILEGIYISSARDTEPPRKAPLLIYNPPGTMHRDRFAELSGKFLGIALCNSSLEHALEYAPLPEQPIGLHAGEAISIARRVADECAVWDCGSELLVEGLCWELLAQVAKCNRGNGRIAPRWLKKARNLLRDGCALEFGVSDVAHQIGVHPVHFVRAFRKFFNCTPGDYLRRCRVEKARSLVAGSTLSLSETALECGYSDQSQLSKAFKRYLGVSPREYRQNHRARAQN